MSSLLLLTVLVAGAAGQVVQIEGKRIRTDKPGWAGEVSASAQFVKNRNDVTDIGMSLHLQFKTGRSLWLILNTLDFIRAGRTDFENRGYQHVRYNYKVRDWFTWEAFIQAQYDKPLHLDFRGLVGTGPRFKVFATPKARLYAAALVMYEREDLTGGLPTQRDVRLTSYLSFTIEPNQQFRLVSTTYYQPRVDAFRDRRVASDSTFSAGITEKLSVFASVNVLYDARPPAGVVTTSYTLRNGLAYRF
ncbi:MAG: DUF481 domain-containing protein [Acidobacteria bacterium]|nr:DUF481 domain-containing protein [Acidobacteriota bacterium]